MYKKISTFIAVLGLSLNLSATDLTQVSDVTVTSSVELRAWSITEPALDHLSAFGNRCSLYLTKVDRQYPELNLVSREPKQDGYLYIYAPTEAVSLAVQSVVTSVVEEKGWCNGEPELCDNNDYKRLTATVELSDRAANLWTLNCTSGAVPVSEPTPSLSVSDIDVVSVLAH